MAQSLCAVCFVLVLFVVVAQDETDGSCMLQVNPKGQASQLLEKVHEQSDASVKTLYPRYPLSLWQGKQVKLPEPFFPFWGHVARSIDRAHSEIANVLVGGQSRKFDRQGTSGGGYEAIIDEPSTEAQVLAGGLSKATYAQWQQDLILEPIFDKMGSGFFVESGALDGEDSSNTLLIELKKGWTGLLVEPNPKEYPILKSKKRHAWSYNGCLSPSGHDETLQFDGANVGAEGLAHLDDSGAYTVLCQPLHMLMEQLNRSTVDFWSLDIEGSESSVLKSTDFEKVEVGMLLIEMNKNDENNKGIEEVMQKQGFQKIGHTLYNEGNGPQLLDNIFINPKYFEKRNLTVPTEGDIQQKVGVSLVEPSLKGQGWPVLINPIVCLFFLGSLSWGRHIV